jgi:hypothetical protein
VTAQALDYLTHEGKQCLMRTELALKKHPRIMSLSDRDAREQFDMCFTTACWRNYLGEWEIRKNRLFLNRLRGKYNLIGPEPLAAEWVSGTIHVEECEIISDFWDDKYNGGNPREFVVEVQRGVVLHSDVKQ